MLRRTMLVRSLSALGAILILAAGCADQGPMESLLTPRVSVLSMAHDAGVASEEIGPEGGTIVFGNGSLTIPAGALAAPTTITASVDGATLAVTFSPHGLVFPATAQPVLSFDVLGVQIPADASIFYLGTSNEALERYEMTLDPVAGSASTRIGHFSPYAIAVE